MYQSPIRLCESSQQNTVSTYETRMSLRITLSLSVSEKKGSCLFAVNNKEAHEKQFEHELNQEINNNNNNNNR